MNSYKKLVNNSAIFAVGNLGSKLIIFFLVPLYTYYLTTSDFGTSDLITTTINLLIPIVTLSIKESVLRFVMDKQYDKKVVLINSFVVMIIGFMLFVLLYPIIAILLPFYDYIQLFYVLLFFQSLNVLVTQYVRAKGMVKLFALSGIINAFSLLVSTILLMIIFELAITGYILSFIIANIVSSIFVISFGKILKDIDTRRINFKILKEMLWFSIPLIPNALMWWIIGFSDRYIITYILGLSANGLYAVASRIPSILSVINSIFFQAWQMSAIEEYESKDKSKFYSNVFSMFSVLMFVGTSIIIVFLKYIMDILVADAYYEAWKYIPFLLLGAVFSSFSQFLGTNYIAAKQTLGVFKSSVVGAFLNLTLNLLLIPIMGIYGASVGTMISFLIIWIIRVIDTKKFVEIKLKVNKMVFNILVISLQIFILYMNLKFEFMIEIFLFILLLIINKSEIRILIKNSSRILKGKISKKSKN